MNTTTVKGAGQDMGGMAKQTLGEATGDTALQNEGVADQIVGNVNKAVGAAKDALSGGTGPLVDQARDFARAKPWATAALVGVVGLAILNTLRGK